MRVGELGYWWRSVGATDPPRAPLTGDQEADVAIVGAGYTGLWTAHYLKLADPSLHVVVLERERAGFGASGRNGGWVSGFFSGPPRVYERRGGRAGFVALQREMLAAVDEVGAFLRSHDVDADFCKGGQLAVALNHAQLERLRSRLANARAHGLGGQDLRELGRAELVERVRVSGALGAIYSPHVARVHPVKLLGALAQAVVSQGVTIHEATPVLEIAPHRARTAAGAVSARWVVRACEGYTAQLPGLRRVLAPINSSMIITEPLPAQAWEQIGWQGAEVLSDAASVYCYLQRTVDGRIAIGGRGVPYRFGSRSGGRGDTANATIELLARRLAAMFPSAASIPIDHAWSGVLGVARDWCVSVQADRARGLAWAGGYVGEGVACANLTARTLCDLMLQRDSALTALPWVGRSPRRWEPEPLRWLEINALYALYRQADRREQRGVGGPSRLAGMLDRASGRV